MEERGEGYAENLPESGRKSLTAAGAGVDDYECSYDSENEEYQDSDFEEGEQHGWQDQDVERHLPDIYATSSSDYSPGRGTKMAGGVINSVSSVTGKSVRAMVGTLQPKSVTIEEIATTWKFEQVIGKPPGEVQKCAATVELRRDGTVVTTFRGREFVSEYTFRAHAWPRACSIEFEAVAFQGPWDEEPVLKFYRGVFSRKLMDPKIITLKGHIFDVTGKMMWKHRVRSGKFVGKQRRPMVAQRGKSKKSKSISEAKRKT
ncbi:unnamed protein product [Choristocarpus tenellus]